jgi:hypothetical protein
VTIPETLRAPCKGPKTPLRTQRDDDRYKIGMEAALAKCSDRGDKLVEIIDETNPKRKKRFGLF